MCLVKTNGQYILWSDSSGSYLILMSNVKPSYVNRIVNLIFICESELFTEKIVYLHCQSSNMGIFNSDLDAFTNTLFKSLKSLAKLNF